MPSKVSFVDNTTATGPFTLAHYNLLATIRHFCGGFGDLGTIGGTRTGTGTLAGLEASPTSVTETWTLTCTAAAVDGGTFSVTGSVSGVKADATVGAAYDNGLLKFTLNDGATDFIVGDVFSIPVTLGAASAAGIAYEILRYDTSTENHELIMKAHGLSGTEEIFLGLRTYHSVSSDYYNLVGSVMTGYVPENTFDSQPGAVRKGIPTHNNRIDYWLSLNGQRIAFALKVGTPVYEHMYLGKFLPYARPSQYPYPVVCAGAFDGYAATRFSETTHDFYPRGAGNARMAMRDPMAWIAPHCYPWGNTYLTGTTYQQRDTDNNYPLTAISLNNNSSNVYGELDGVFHVSGFNNAVENVITIGGVDYVVMQAVSRTSHVDYYALRLDA